MKYQYDYPRAALTVDIGVFGYREGKLQVLLIERGHPPFQGKWALPGGFLEMKETLVEAAHRELEEEVGIKGIHLELLSTFDALDRDPRERVISVAFFGLVDPELHSPQAASDAAQARWFGIDRLPPLAFDHAEIIACAVRRIQES